ncbi:unnamed protein product, partial [marine sediment metagenome]
MDKIMNKFSNNWILDLKGFHIYENIFIDFDLTRF